MGKVEWYRNYEEAVAIAKKENRDIVILFQEVPGCATCRNYGRNVLSHPLIAEALENSFVPLAIHNNKGGEDKKTLNKFNEPSWNNPVVRIVDVNGKDQVKRIGGDYSASTLISRMKEALIEDNKSVPVYMNLLEQELIAANSSDIVSSTYKMYCFWTGEKKLGQVDGVLDVESGFVKGSEVVRVEHNRDEISQSELDAYAEKQGFVRVEVKDNYRTASNDVHYYLRHSIYQYLPLSELQKTRINSALGSKQNPENYLSPSQKTWLRALKSGKIKTAKPLLDLDIEEAWSNYKVQMLKDNK